VLLFYLKGDFKMNYVLNAQNISKSYQDKKVVNNITIQLKKGEVFGLLGANGAGKSTIIECIIGTKVSDEGSVEILGLDPNKNHKTIFEMVGVQFQDSNYQDKIKVSELCEETYSLYKNATNYYDLLKKFKLTDLKDQMVNELSGGERQRLFIVLALISNPKIVFLDELTTGLDARNRRNVWKYLEELKKEGLTIFLTSHYMDEVETLCDKIMILKKGKLVFQGTTKEAISNSPYKTLEEAYLWYTDEEDQR
jgi:ABC-2 type transport system ATP-binding protein